MLIRPIQFPQSRFKQLGYLKLRYPQLRPLEPTDVKSATLLAYYNCPESISVASSLIGSGTSPPAVNVSTSDNFRHPDGIWVDMTVGGLRGTAKFNAGIDNPLRATQILTDVFTAASVPMTGTPWTLNFTGGASSYNANNLYQAACSPWMDLVSGFPTSVNNLTNNAGTGSTTTPLIYVSGALGAPCLSFDSTKRLEVVSALANAAFGGVNHPFYALLVGNMDTYPGAGQQGTFWAACNPGNASNPTVQQSITGLGSQKWRMNRRSDAGVAHQLDSTTPASLGQFVLEMTFDGTYGRDSCNTGDVIGGTLGVLDQTATIITPDRISFGARHINTGFSEFTKFQANKFAIFDQRPTSSEVVGIMLGIMA